MFSSSILGLGIVLLMSTLTFAQTSKLPPEGSKPVSEIVQSVEKLNLGVITEVEFEDGYWEVEIQKGDTEIELHLDPKTCEILRRKEKRDPTHNVPPEGSKPLSEIVQSVEKRDLGTITEVEFEDGFWEFEIRKTAMKIKLYVDPRTGKDRGQ